jgi:hypothetical protein
MKIDKKFIIKKALPVLGGALLGYAYYYFIGCYSGTCPITSNPYISTFYGALIAFILVLPSKKKSEQLEENK